jgi:hypothetical protein
MYDSGYDVVRIECPSWQPMCSSRVDTEEPDVVCVGERLGPCEEEGFIRCENLEEVVLCVPSENGSLVESRGECGEGLACLPPGVGETDWEGGCLAIYTPAA